MIGVALIEVALIGVALIGVTLIRVALIGVTLIGVALIGVALIGVALIGVAESEGFEPPDGLTRQRFSRPPHSTTLPTLRRHCGKQRIIERRATFCYASEN